MPIVKQSETTRDEFTVREYVYDSGLIEISLLTPEVISGAGPILRGVVSRQPVKGGKFVGHTSRRNRVAINRKREIVIAATIDAIRVDMR